METAVRVADLLDLNGVSAGVLSMHTVKPLDAEATLEAARATGAIFTLEEHSVMGGLGSAVSEVLAESREGMVTFKRFGLPSAFSSMVGTQEYLRAQHGLSAESLAAAIHSILKKAPALMSTAKG